MEISRWVLIGQWIRRRNIIPPAPPARGAIIIPEIDSYVYENEDPEVNEINTQEAGPTIFNNVSNGFILPDNTICNRCRECEECLGGPLPDECGDCSNCFLWRGVCNRNGVMHQLIPCTENSDSYYGYYGNRYTGGRISGTTVSINQTGNIIAVGYPMGKLVTTDPGRGVVITYNYDATLNRWIENGRIWGLDNCEWFGSSISLNARGDILAVGARFAKNGRDYFSGKTNVYQWNGSDWQIMGEPIITGSNDFSGYSIKLDQSGNILIIGCPGGDENDLELDGFDCGKVICYRWILGRWSQRGNIIYGKTGSLLTRWWGGTQAGSIVTMTNDGNVIAFLQNGRHISGGEDWGTEIPSSIDEPLSAINVFRYNDRTDRWNEIGEFKIKQKMWYEYPEYEGYEFRPEYPCNSQFYDIALCGSILENNIRFIISCEGFVKRVNNGIYLEEPGYQDIIQIFDYNALTNDWSRAGTINPLSTRLEPGTTPILNRFFYNKYYISINTNGTKIAISPKEKTYNEIYAEKGLHLYEYDSVSGSWYLLGDRIFNSRDERITFAGTTDRIDRCVVPPGNPLSDDEIDLSENRPTSLGGKVALNGDGNRLIIGAGYINPFDRIDSERISGTVGVLELRRYEIPEFNPPDDNIPCDENSVPPCIPNVPIPGFCIQASEIKPRRPFLLPTVDEYRRNYYPESKLGKYVLSARIDNFERLNEGRYQNADISFYFSNDSFKVFVNDIEIGIVYSNIQQVPSLTRERLIRNNNSPQIVEFAQYVDLNNEYLVIASTGQNPFKENSNASNRVIPLITIIPFDDLHNHLKFNNVTTISDFYNIYLNKPGNPESEKEIYSITSIHISKTNNLFFGICYNIKYNLLDDEYIENYENNLYYTNTPINKLFMYARSNKIFNFLFNRNIFQFGDEYLIDSLWEEEEAKEKEIIKNIKTVFKNKQESLDPEIGIFVIQEYCNKGNWEENKRGNCRVMSRYIYISTNPEQDILKWSNSITNDDVYWYYKTNHIFKLGSLAIDIYHEDNKAWIVHSTFDKATNTRCDFILKDYGLSIIEQDLNYLPDFDGDIDIIRSYYNQIFYQSENILSIKIRNRILLLTYINNENYNIHGSVYQLNIDNTLLLSSEICNYTGKRYQISSNIIEKLDNLCCKTENINCLQYRYPYRENNITKMDNNQLSTSINYKYIEDIGYERVVIIEYIIGNKFYIWNPRDTVDNLGLILKYSSGYNFDRIPGKIPDRLSPMRMVLYIKQWIIIRIFIIIINLIIKVKTTF